METNRPDEMRRHLERALGEAMKQAVVDAQAWLGSTNNVPRRSGRMRSSWFAQVGGPSGATAPDGADAPNDDAQQLEVQIDRDYHLTNNLPYAAPVALGEQIPPSWQNGYQIEARGGNNWFLDFRAVRLPMMVEEALAQTKRRFGL